MTIETIGKSQGRPKKRLSFAEKVALVVDAMKASSKFAECWSTRELAQMTGYSYSTKFREFLDKMVDNGYICVAGYRYNGGACDERYLFMLPENYVPYDSNNRYRTF